MIADRTASMPPGPTPSTTKPMAPSTSPGPRSRFVRGASDSLVEWVVDGGRRPQAIWFPIVNLVWLGWMLAAPWVFAQPSPALIATTYASVALFLVLYWRAYFASRSRLVFHTTAIAVLGLAIVLVNTSWSYVIYAGSLIPFCTRGWRTAAWVALLLAAFYVVAIASGFFTPLLTLGAIFTTAIVALLQTVYRVNAERDTALRLTQDEVRRLAVTAERERIGRDLHDLLGHTLSLIAIKAELARRVVLQDPTAAQRELGDIERVARQALGEVRSAVTGIRAAALAGELASARLMLEADRIAVDYDGDGAVATLSAEAESALSLGLREAVTNVHRHARATRVEIRIATRDGMVELSIRDDGRGGVRSRGNNLAGMEERHAAVGGDVSLSSQVGNGTLVRLRVPIPRGGIA